MAASMVFYAKRWTLTQALNEIIKWVFKDIGLPDSDLNGSWFSWSLS